jgi:hypothetical protein
MSAGFTWRSGFGFKKWVSYFPIWCPALVAGIAAASLGVRRSYQISFSLRTLLIATTLIAIVLGLVVWSIE